MFLFLGATCYLFIRAIAQSSRSHAEKACKGTTIFWIGKIFLQENDFFLHFFCFCYLYLSLSWLKRGKKKDSIYFFSAAGFYFFFLRFLLLVGELGHRRFSPSSVLSPRSCRLFAPSRPSYLRHMQLYTHTRHKAVKDDAPPARCSMRV